MLGDAQGRVFERVVERIGRVGEESLVADEVD